MRPAHASKLIKDSNEKLRNEEVMSTTWWIFAFHGLSRLLFTLRVIRREKNKNKEPASSRGLSVWNQARVQWNSGSRSLTPQTGFPFFYNAMRGNKNTTLRSQSAVHLQGCLCSIYRKREINGWINKQKHSARDRRFLQLAKVHAVC